MRYRLSGGRLPFALRIFPAPGDHQSNSADEREPSEDWGYGNSVSSVRGDMHGPHVHHIFAARIGETLVGQCQGSENYEDNSDYGDRFHSFDVSI
jgi:hypothetical protein